ncbi:hypothetical protein Tco_0068881 [Tanacetum coccineum]
MIDKFLFPSDFMVIDMLEARNETVILRRPFLATIHDKINVFNRITFNMNKKIHNFTTPIKIVHVINSVQDGEPYKIITPPPHKSSLCLELEGNSNLINQNNNTLDNDGMQERFSKKARIDETDPTTPKVHIYRHVKQDCNETFKIWPTYDLTKNVCNGGEDIYGIDENGKLREWYYRHDDKRSGLTGEGLSFPDFLLVK